MDTAALAALGDQFVSATSTLLSIGVFIISALSVVWCIREVIKLVGYEPRAVINSASNYYTQDDHMYSPQPISEPESFTENEPPPIETYQDYADYVPSEEFQPFDDIPPDEYQDYNDFMPTEDFQSYRQTTYYMN